MFLPSRAAFLSAQHGLTHVGVVNVVAVCGRRGGFLGKDKSRGSRAHVGKLWASQLSICQRRQRWFVSTDSCILHDRREQGGERREEGEQLGGREEEEEDPSNRSTREGFSTLRFACCSFAY